MSDTTITIAPEERRTWRNEHANWTGRDSDLVVRVRLLDALEITEALLDSSCQEARANFSAVYHACTEIIPNLKSKLEAAEKALLKEEVYSEEMESQLQDAESEYNANWAVQALSRLGALLDVSDLCAATGDNLDDFVFDEVVDLKKRAEQAEAENARLRAERDWLASWGDAHPCCMDLQCPFGRTLEQCEAREGGMLDSTECWQEAARRAVAGEGEVRE